MIGIGGGGGGGEEEPPPLIVEQTSSSEHHYELMALVQAVAAGFGLDQEKPYLEQMRDDIHAIRVLMEQTWAVTELLRQEAQDALAAHAQSAQEYLRQVEEPIPVDYYPFESMPAGTTVRDLPDGGRLFGFTDGAFLRVFPDGQMRVNDENGMATAVSPASGGKVTLPDGREFHVVADAFKVTHETAGIEGLPDGVDPVMASPGRYTALLPDGTRLDVYHREKAVAVANPCGTIVVLGISRIYGIGEDVDARSISGDAKSFRTEESKLAGLIESDGTIHLSVVGGLDLVIRFPEEGGTDEESGGSDGGPVCFNCVEPD